jgi:serine/threonine protein kinase
MKTRYQIIESGAGEGGFGRIDKAFDMILERNIAMKILDPLFKESPSPQDTMRFSREAKTLASLSHPHIPAIYDVVFPENNGEFKLIVEWIEGITVREFLNTRGVMSLEQISRWFANICSALEHAHRHDIIHRDIKPANLVITTDMEACYLVDFGVSLRQSDLQRLTPSNYLVGTPGYLSPEQQKGEELDASSDIYSLAIVLYECLAGQLPRVGEYHALNTINVAVPPTIDDLVLRCLGDKAQRLNSASDFYKELTKALQPYGSLAEILSHGSIHEIQAALIKMEPRNYAELPIGQQLLIISNVKELIEVDQFNMRSAVASLLSELVRVGYQSRESDYAFVIEHSYHYGYEKQYNGQRLGNSQLRDSLNQVATISQQSAHQILSEKLLFFLKNLGSLEKKEKWYYHDLKNLLRNLLANPYCAANDAERLVECLEKVNKILMVND